MLSYISPNSSAAPSPRSCVSPSPLAHKLNVIGSPLALSPHGSPSFRGIVHPVTPPPFALASDKPSTTGKSATTGLGAGGHPTALGRQYSTLGAPSGLGGAHVSKSMSTYGSFDYEAEGSNYPAKRMDSVHEALKELHEILMGDVGSSESSSDSGEDAGEGAFEMDDDDEDEARDEVKLPVSPPSVGIMSGRRASLMAAQRPREKPSKGWRKGVARESVRFQLMVDVPCWEPGCYSDLSSMQALRDKTLKALHNLIDSLHLRGIRSTYRLHSTANGGAWGCIRVAPFMSSRLGPSASSSYHKAPTSPLSSFSPVTPSSLLLNAQTRRSTVAGSLPMTSSSWSGDGKAAMLEKKEMDEKERVAERIKKALEEDGEGIVEENRTYLLAVNGQPALILT